jgi:hypothetical protein
VLPSVLDFREPAGGPQHWCGHHIRCQTRRRSAVPIWTAGRCTCPEICIPGSCG